MSIGESRAECPIHVQALACAHLDGYAAAILPVGDRYRVEVTDRQGGMMLPGTASLERSRSLVEAWIEASRTEWKCQPGT